jgi:hypothetical protein
VDAIRKIPVKCYSTDMHVAGRNPRPGILLEGTNPRTGILIDPAYPLKRTDLVARKDQCDFARSGREFTPVGNLLIQ